MWQLAVDTINQDDLDALADWLRTGPRLTQGDQVKAFESAWASWLGCKNSVMVTSGTTANFMLMAAVERRVQALHGRKPRVGVAAVTWSTNVSPSLLLGHEVVLFDVDRRTLGVDAASACAAMERGAIDVLFVTHLLGFCALSSAILTTAQKTGVVILEDTCESHGARFGTDGDARKAGTLGLASTFSFYFGHHMSTIEGGVVCTDDEAFADELRLWRAHGLARESRDPAAHAARAPEVDPRFLFVLPGLNFRSTELNAVLGLRQLPRLDASIAARNRNLRRFLAQAPGQLWTDFLLGGVSSFALPLIAHDERDAARLRQVLDDVGVESRPVVAGNLLHQPFLKAALQSGQARAVGPLPVAEHVHRAGCYVGNGPHVSDAMIDDLGRALRAAFGAGAPSSTGST